MTPTAPDPDLQERLYQAAKADDRPAVTRLLKETILPQKPQNEHGAFSVTIDLAAGQMSTMSLLVLCLQGNATGLFRFLAESKPDDIRRMGPPLVEATGNMLFVEPLARLGVDASAFGPLGQQALKDLKQPDIAQGNLEKVKQHAKTNARKLGLG